ncbi:MAG: radical SAM protein [Xanthomonadales bacterium]|jgi:radical SAM protein with 4Fe4S-binding SPASM domain|nr:radical SAM protein [Xanthomonadales bacterium]
MKRKLSDNIKDALRALIAREIRFEYEHIPIRIRKAPFRKALNWVAVEASIAFKSEQPWGLPTYLQIEPTTICNLGCKYCPVSERTDEPVGHQDPELARRLIDELHETALLVVLWGWGEPFLSPGIYDVIRHARDRGLVVISSTNGHLFAKDKQARRVVESGIDKLLVSTSGMSPESYKGARRGSFELPLKGVRNIVKWKRELGLKKPFLSLTLIITQDNEHEIEEARAVAEGLGVDMLNFKRINPTTTSKGVPLPSDKSLRRFDYDGEGTPRVVKENRCKALFHKTTLRWDGRVNSCTFDIHDDSNLGDFNSGSFRDIWRGSAYRRMRSKFRRNWRDIPICTRCTYGFEGGYFTESVIESISYEAGEAPEAPGPGPDSTDQRPRQRPNS